MNTVEMKINPPQPNLTWHLHIHVYIYPILKKHFKCYGYYRTLLNFSRVCYFCWQSIVMKDRMWTLIFSLKNVSSSYYIIYMSNWFWKAFQLDRVVDMKSTDNLILLQICLNNNCYLSDTCCSIQNSIQNAITSSSTEMTKHLELKNTEMKNQQCFVHFFNFSMHCRVLNMERKTTTSLQPNVRKHQVWTWCINKHFVCFKCYLLFNLVTEVIYLFP